MFIEYDQDQAYLLPPSPRDWLPEGHLVWFMSDTVDQLNIDPILDKYRGGGKGQLAYHPRLMLKILFYAYSVGVFSSRKIAKQIEENLAFRVLAGSQAPGHRTICRFREENLEEFERLFVEIVQLALASGIGKMGTLAIDGSKVKANASKHKAMSYERMKKEEKRLREEIRRLIRVAAKQDKLEDGEFGPDFRGDELPEELRRRETRLATIQAAKKRLEERKATDAKAQDDRKADRDNDAGSGRGGSKTSTARKGQPKPKDQENFTDPDSRIMKVGTGFQQSYNAQIAVEESRQLIVAVDVSQCASDTPALIPMIDRAETNTGEMPRRVLADAGYRSEENLQALETRELRGYVAIGREGKKARLDPKKEATARMIRRLQGKRGRAQYKKRKGIVEPVFGWIKQVTGFRQFSLRGQSKVRGEWSLICLATNLRRMHSMLAWE
jgi:transposase